MAFFQKQYKRKKVLKIAGTKRKRGGQIQNDVTQETVLEKGQQLTEEEAEIAAVLEDDEAIEADGDAEGVHNEEVVNTVKARAIGMMKRQGVEIAAQEEKDALALLPKVSINMLILYMYRIVTARC